MMNGHRTIIAARKAGLKPSSIFFNVDTPVGLPYDSNEPTPEGWFFESGLTRTKRFNFDEPENALRLKLYAHVELSLSEPWRTFDLRFVTGCHIHINADHWSDDLIDLGEKVANHGANSTIICCVRDCGDILKYQGGVWNAYR